jgi:hypothetical protein
MAAVIQGTATANKQSVKPDERIHCEILSVNGHVLLGAGSLLALCAFCT